MNEQALRGYAMRGLAARLAELDGERERILALMAVWQGTPRPRAVRKPRDLRPLAVDVAGEAAAPSASAPEPDSPSVAQPEAEVARVLPRRGVLRRQLADDPALATLPPMPRLNKAKAS